jgi:glycerophosphoryl diester phosphodiesterase
MSLSTLHPTSHSGPVVIAHRGASGYRPEHTLAAYRMAIRQGADYIEPDLVSTRDGVLVARHENEISQTTDVALRSQFAQRRTTKVIDGRETTGWFTEDFTLEELRSLRAVERLPRLRPENTHYDRAFRIPTFAEILDLAQRESRRRGTVIGVYPETKHPSYFASLGLGLERPLLTELRSRHLDRPNSPVLVQSFETANLRMLARVSRVPLVQLVDATGAPHDLVAAGDDRTYADLVTPAGLRAVASYAAAIGAAKHLVLPRDASGGLGAPSSLVDDAHAVGLAVHVWTLRAEAEFLPRGVDAHGEAAAFLDAGVDGIFTDHPDVALEVRAERTVSAAAPSPTR